MIINMEDCIHMSTVREMHKLTKNIEWIIDIGPSHSEVSKVQLVDDLKGSLQAAWFHHPVTNANFLPWEHLKCVLHAFHHFWDHPENSYVDKVGFAENESIQFQDNILGLPKSLIRNLISIAKVPLPMIVI